MRPPRSRCRRRIRLIESLAMLPRPGISRPLAQRALAAGWCTGRSRSAMCEPLSDWRMSGRRSCRWRGEPTRGSARHRPPPPPESRAARGRDEVAGAARRGRRRRCPGSATTLPPPPPAPRPARSNISVVLATAQPLLMPPMAASTRHADVGEEHLVEHRAAGDLLQRPDLDARLVHVDREVRDALVLGHVGIGPASSMPRSRPGHPRSTPSARSRPTRRRHEPPWC